MPNAKNFIETIIDKDIADGFSKRNLRFRFPPEPNGYLHIGHAKAIAINFGLGENYKSPVNLRFDDTNPLAEEKEYVDSIIKDVKWLGYSWNKITYSSDNFGALFEWALMLIKENKAYVDSQASAEIASQKGTTTKPGKNSPYRDRPVEESLKIFNEMKQGKHPEGKHVLRAKISMSDPNMLMRDPVLYRVIHKEHHKTRDTWCIYPMYDWAHGQSDYCEQISHSLCSLEFKPHRKLYDWFINALRSQEVKNLKIIPKQREFARLNLSYTIMSKRKLSVLVEKKVVQSWDDPRMPTISGLRRRGYTPSSIRTFIKKVGVAKRENLIDVSLLEFCVREELNKTSNRKMVVSNPLKLTIENYSSTETEQLESENNPEKESAGNRKLSFNRNIFIENEDFLEEANRKFFRLTLGREVRLKSAYIIKAERVVKNASGKITEVICTYDPKSKSGSGSPESKRKVKGTLHWVSASDGVPVEIREYDRLFKSEAPGAKGEDFFEEINESSLKILNGIAEPSLKDSKIGENFQFQRKGYYTVDKDSNESKLVFNKTVGLRDNWKKSSS